MSKNSDGKSTRRSMAERHPMRNYHGLGSISFRSRDNVPYYLWVTEKVDPVNGFPWGWATLDSARGRTWAEDVLVDQARFSFHSPFRNVYFANSLIMRAVNLVKRRLTRFPPRFFDTVSRFFALSPLALYGFRNAYIANSLIMCAINPVKRLKYGLLRFSPVPAKLTNNPPNNHV